MSQNQKPKVYIAGPEVFLPNAPQFFKKISEFCESQGLEALVPFDTPVEGAPDPTSLEIFERNLAKIRNCDGVVACVEYFRGTEPDSGTCMEIGYAKALGKVIVTYAFECYNNEQRTLDHFVALGELQPDETVYPDFVYPDGMKAESFGHPFNLMIWHAGQYVGSDIFQAIMTMKTHLYPNTRKVEGPLEEPDEMTKALMLKHPDLERLLTIYESELQKYPEDGRIRKISPSREKLLQIMAQLHHDGTKFCMTPGEMTTVSQYLEDKKPVLKDFETMPAMTGGYVFSAFREFYRRVV